MTLNSTQSDNQTINNIQNITRPKWNFRPNLSKLRAFRILYFQGTTNLLTIDTDNNKIRVQGGMNDITVVIARQAVTSGANMAVLLAAQLNAQAGAIGVWTVTQSAATGFYTVSCTSPFIAYWGSTPTSLGPMYGFLFDTPASLSVTSQIIYQPRNTRQIYLCSKSLSSIVDQRIWNNNQLSEALLAIQTTSATMNSFTDNTQMIAYPSLFQQEVPIWTCTQDQLSEIDIYFTNQRGEILNFTGDALGWMLVLEFFFDPE